LTIGQMPAASTPTPAAVPSTPAANSRSHRARRGRPSFIHVPAIRPRIMVARVGTKLNVAYPPPLPMNSFSRPNRFKNQRSNAAAGLVLMFQWAKNPV